jgi:hypothetical protein
MNVRVILTIGVIVSCVFFGAGYMLAAEKAPESSGYKILVAPMGPTAKYNTWQSVIGSDGIPRDFLNGCVPISISTSPDPQYPALLILCKGKEQT